MVSRRAIDLIVIAVVMVAAAVYYLAGGAPDPAPAAGVIGGAMIGLAMLSARAGARLARLPVLGRVALIAAASEVTRIAAELPAAVVAAAASRARIAASLLPPPPAAPRHLPSFNLTPRLIPVPRVRRA
jgi:hypothetical protein